MDLSGKISPETMNVMRKGRVVQIKPHELTLRAVVIATVLTLILATANAFLALKLGMLTSASIPAAILSMGILRFFKNANIWENNLVQTAASAGEAVAGGIVYTIPALIIIGFWQDFAYWPNFFLALSSGCLGVLFSVPLRKSLVHHPALPFPEGRAIAAILQNHTTSQSFKILIWGLLLGAMIDFAQTGLHLIANQSMLWFKCGSFTMVLGMGFAVAMMSAGFLVGIRMALSIAIGVSLVSFVLLPLLSYGQLEPAVSLGPKIWNEQVRYIGIGALLFAGVMSLLSFLKPLLKKMVQVRQTDALSTQVLERERDIPKSWIWFLVLLFSVGIFYFLVQVLPIDQLGFKTGSTLQLALLALSFIVVIGFLMSVVMGYFSAMVGVSASPGSSVVISSLLLAAWGILGIMRSQGILMMDAERLAAEAIAIVLASMVTGIAAIANDNIQDLKVGQLIGATPWRQQVMLMLGVLVSASIIPAVMKILYHVYGFSGKTDALPAPTAFLLATLTEGFFQHDLPWEFIGLGGGLVLLLALGLRWIPALRGFGLSIFGVAIGIYLPLETSTPLVLGGCLAYVIQQRESRAYLAPGSLELAICLACGLVAGSAVMDVLLAFYFALSGQTDSLVFLPLELLSYAPMWTLALLCLFILWISRLRIKSGNV